MMFGNADGMRDAYAQIAIHREQHNLVVLAVPDPGGMESTQFAITTFSVGAVGYARGINRAAPTLAATICMVRCMSVTDCFGYYNNGCIGVCPNRANSRITRLYAPPCLQRMQTPIITMRPSTTC